MEKKIDPTEAERFALRSVFHEYQQTIIRSLDALRESGNFRFDTAAQLVLVSSKMFLGLGIKQGYIAGYRDLKVDQNLTLYAKIIISNDKNLLPVSLELQPSAGQS